MDLLNNIRTFPGEVALAEAAAGYITDLAKYCVATHGRFSIALSGGKTPESTYTLLSRPPFAAQMPWEHTFIFWGDERCVPPGNQQNNAHMAMKALLDKVPVPSGNIFPVRTDLAPEMAASEYDCSIKNFFRNELPCFDLILLGLGGNGHTASLFPETEVLKDDTHLVKEVYIAEQNMFRITMTAKFINQAKNIVFLVAGAGKAGILNTVLTAPWQPDKYPAQLIQPANGNLYWFTDEDAASVIGSQC